ncbi:CoxG family protein [Hypericibacter sp.]|uniref:CoxG family protein n=1 Tax=Hypericibacter sp. TaxID=2705401 RepID=UPI003D6D671D
MKFRQEFHVTEKVAKLWEFFEQPARVAECIPGVEKVALVDDDNLTVVATQRLGPMAATFEARVQIVERVREQKIQFTSTGKAVRGAIGNFRATNTVFLNAAGDQTQIVVEGEAVLAGVLGSIGQKVIAKQAEKVTAEFARNLEKVLSGNAALPADRPGVRPLSPVEAIQNEKTPPCAEASGPAHVVPARDPWVKVAALLSGTATVVGLVILWRLGAH